MKILVYNNRKMDRIYWDISTREKALGAFLKMFQIEDEQWDAFAGGTDIEPRLQKAYKAAKAGDARGAYILFSDLRPPGTFGSFSIDEVETEVYEKQTNPPTPEEEVETPEPASTETLLKDAFYAAKYQSIDIGGAVKELTDTLSSLALLSDPQKIVPSQMQRFVWSMDEAIRRCTKAYKGLQKSYSTYKANKEEPAR